MNSSLKERIGRSFLQDNLFFASSAPLRESYSRIPLWLLLPRERSRDFDLDVLCLEDGQRTGAVGTDECRGFGQLRILHVRIRQIPFALVPPFDAAIHARVGGRGGEQSDGLWIVFCAD